MVEHQRGPLLVLAGPGTGKTTTLVEAAAARVQAGLAAEQVLVLTFSRRAAVDLRRRIAQRLGRSVATPRAVTFHSFCHSVVRRFGDPELYGEAVRLLTAPEQDYRVREVLAARSPNDWPPELAAAYLTRGFASEVRGALATARQLGLDADVLRAWGREYQRPAWTSLGNFLDTYLDVLEAEQVLDYAELVYRARVLLADPRIRDQVRRNAQTVLVDEYQDIDLSQAGLLRQLVPVGGDLIVMGDPDQSIDEFRGARPRAILDFPKQFRTVDGQPAPVVTLSTSCRLGSVLVAATRRIADRLALPRPLPEPIRQGFRHLEPDPNQPPGVVEVLTYTDPAAQADQIADLLRRAHLCDGLAWTEMAVVVRSGNLISSLTRSLLTAGVPVEVAGDEIAFGTCGAVKPLLLALEVACHRERLDADAATQLLLSPLGGLDSIQLRRLGRALRARHRGQAGTPRSSAELIRQALTEPKLLAEAEPTPEVVTAAGLAQLVDRCRRAVTSGATAHQTLWLLWQATTWPQRLTAALAAGPDQARAAHRDLDAICALFDGAQRYDELSSGRGVPGFLAEVAAQQIPADRTRESDLRDRGVRILTAHRCKGLEWPLVVVAGVQEGNWPDPRRRGSLLETDRLTADGRTDTSVGAAGSRAATLLRGLYPRPAQTCRDRGRRCRRGGRPALPVPDRAGCRTGASNRPSPPAAQPHRPGHRITARGRRFPATPGRPGSGGTAAGGPGRGDRRERQPAGAGSRPRPLVGNTRPDPGSSARRYRTGPVVWQPGRNPSGLSPPVVLAATRPGWRAALDSGESRLSGPRPGRACGT